jgi:ribonuclease BN (tRNA processing enzyme)
VSPEILEKVLENNQSPTMFPVGLREMASIKEIRSVREMQVILWDKAGVRVAGKGTRFEDDALVINIHKSYAHPGGVYIYRVTWRGKSIVYATDTEGYVDTDRRLVQFSQGADLLIHDAQYSEKHYCGQMTGFSSTQGYGHSTVTMACEVATAASVGKLVLFHHDPAYDDNMLDEIQDEAQKRFENVISAYEGLTLSFSSSRSRREVMARDQWRVKYAQDG